MACLRDRQQKSSGRKLGRFLPVVVKYKKNVFRYWVRMGIFSSSGEVVAKYSQLI